MLPHILPLIPAHTLYTEAFAGGGAVLFAKPPSKVEIINDTNCEVINFYRVVQQNFAALQTEIQCTLHSRDLHRQARVVYENPDMFDSIKRAWAFWMLANQSFGSSLVGGWSYDNSSGKMPHKLQNKRDNFTQEYALRLQNTQIECCEALRLIASRDCEDAFFYLDPPYFQANMGHYGGYTARHFEDLLLTLSQIKGKFLLSSYPSELLPQELPCIFYPIKQKISAVMKFITDYNLQGLIVGLATFVIIGLFHPLVIKAEYYWGARRWWVFLCFGIANAVLSVLAQNPLASVLTGVVAFSSFWSIREMLQQERRVKKGWFPKNSKRK